VLRVGALMPAIASIGLQPTTTAQASIRGTASSPWWRTTGHVWGSAALRAAACLGVLLQICLAVPAIAAT
jgi:hypothetical protein